MRILLKYLSLILISCFVLQINAQSIIIKSGLNLSDQFIQDDLSNIEIPTDFKSGFHGGILIELPLPTFLSIETGLLYTGKGSIQTDDGMGLDAELSINNIDLPVYLKGTFGVNALNIFVEAGPYFGLGISGTAKAGTDSQDIDFIINDDDYDPENFLNLKRQDIGFTVGAGVEIKNFLIGASYDMGLSNLLAELDQGTIKNRLFKFSIGYRLLGN